MASCGIYIAWTKSAVDKRHFCMETVGIDGM